MYVCELSEAPPLRGTITHQSWSAERLILGPVHTGIPHGQISDPLQLTFVNKCLIKDPGFLKNSFVLFMYFTETIKML